MISSNWLAKVRTSVSLGFSRRYILELLTRNPKMTVKEIIDRAIAQSQGRFKPAPSTIYPILGKLLDEGLAEGSKDGRYAITRKGLDMVADLHSSATKAIQKQMKILFRTGKLGRFMAMDLVDRAYAIGSMLNSNLDKMTQEEQEKYRQFLKDELKKLDEEEEEEKKI